MLPKPSNFRYLNREGQWLDFHWSGLTCTDAHALELLPSPMLAGVPPDFSRVPSPSAPAGIAADSSGRVFWTVPDANTVFSSGNCSPAVTALSCLVEGAGLTPLRQPRGLLLLDRARRLALVDSGNHRILFFDTRDLSLCSVWGQDDLAGDPQPGTAPGSYNTPWTMSADGDGNLYVLDFGNARVQKLTPAGDPDTAFTANVRSSVPRPGALAVGGHGSEVSVFVFNLEDQRVYILDGNGSPRLESDGSLCRIPAGGDVVALAASSSVLYVGDNTGRRVLAFSRAEGHPACGDAVGYSGPVAAITIDAAGNLLVSTGTATMPAAIMASGAFLPLGVLWSDAISGDTGPTIWSRFRAELTLPAGTQAEFHYALSSSSVTPPVAPAATQPFSNAAWKALPNGVTDFQPVADNLPFLFVGAVFRSDRSATPSLTQVRATFNDPGYLPLLPAVYRTPPAQPDFLARLLALYGSIFNDLHEEIDDLVRWFSPQGAPPEALPWLATWLAADLEQGEPLARMRGAIATAFRRSGWRGTAEGLRMALLEGAGVRANIVQPIATAGFWAFPADDPCCGVPSAPTGVRLGTSSLLSGMQPGPAVLASTAQLDRSFLISADQFGEPLFDGLANQFIVEVYAGDVRGEERLDLVRRIVEREKPAHTLWRLSVLEDTMRVGEQARVGIDTIVAGTPGPTALGASGARGGMRLGGTPSPRAGQVRLGQEIKLDH